MSGNASIVNVVQHLPVWPNVRVCRNFSEKPNMHTQSGHSQEPGFGFINKNRFVSCSAQPGLWSSKTQMHQRPSLIVGS